MRLRAAALLSLPFLALLGLSGCSTSFAPQVLPSDTPSNLGSIHGLVHGGRQPISGAHIYLLAAGTAGSAGSGLAATTTNASTSLLTNVTTGSFPTAFDSTLNAYYVTTDANGNFTLTGEYTCLSGQQVYLYSLGGNAGAGTVNSAAGLMAVLGQCPGGSLDATVPYVYVNEVSTVAAAFALAGFATDPSHISSDAGVSGNTTAAFATQGIANAAADAALLYDISSSTQQARTATASGTGIVPQTTIHALANSLAACVNSTAANSTQCANLFGAAPKDGNTANTATSNIPTDTAAAAINIAHFPGAASVTVFNQAASIGTPFQPTLTAAPSDFSIGIKYTTGAPGSSYTEGVALDAGGNAWITNQDGGGAVTKISPAGVFLSGAGYTGGGITQTLKIAIDASGSAWMTDASTRLIKLSSTGAVLSGATGYTGGGLSGIFGLAIDLNGNVWVANYYSSTYGTTVSEFNSSGTAISGSGGISGGGLSGPFGISVDAAGSIWVGNLGANIVTKFNSAGTIVSGSGYTGGGLYKPYAGAFDSAGNVFYSDLQTTRISKLSSSGAALSPTAGYTGAGLYYPRGMAVDGAGNAWVGNNGSNGVSEFTNGGTAITGANGYHPAGTNNSEEIQFDGSGNLWITTTSNYVTEMIGAGAPVVTPLVTAAALGKQGTRP